MTKKRKKKTASKFKKSLTQSTHPIPPKKVEPDRKKYDRKRENEETRKEIEQAEDS